ncbi:unnamed protein product [Moneuplotes crassus]|uniref:Uncharacterized protein n=1 Tax=Euplotes crassus TaxID=5936 RepID=A0AAD1U7C9_EUPCR|nr:unnamed protein product [Moneuplotes crassus]
MECMELMESAKDILDKEDCNEFGELRDYNWNEFENTGNTKIEVKMRKRRPSSAKRHFKGKDKPKLTTIRKFQSTHNIRYDKCPKKKAPLEDIKSESWASSATGLELESIKKFSQSPKKRYEHSNLVTLRRDRHQRSKDSETIGHTFDNGQILEIKKPQPTIEGKDLEQLKIEMIREMNMNPMTKCLSVAQKLAIIQEKLHQESSHKDPNAIPQVVKKEKNSKLKEMRKDLKRLSTILRIKQRSFNKVKEDILASPKTKESTNLSNKDDQSNVWKSSEKDKSQSDSEVDSSEEFFGINEKNKVKNGKKSKFSLVKKKNLVKQKATCKVQSFKNKDIRTPFISLQSIQFKKKKEKAQMNADLQDCLNKDSSSRSIPKRKIFGKDNADLDVISIRKPLSPTLKHQGFYTHREAEFLLMNTTELYHALKKSLNKKYFELNCSSVTDSQESLQLVKKAMKLLEEYSKTRGKIKKQLAYRYEDKNSASHTSRVDDKLAEKLVDIVNQIEGLLQPSGYEFRVILGITKQIKARNQAKQLKSVRPSQKISHLKNVSFHQTSSFKTEYNKIKCHKKRKILSNEREPNKSPLIQLNFITRESQMKSPFSPVTEERNIPFIQTHKCSSFSPKKGRKRSPRKGGKQSRKDVLCRDKSSSLMKTSYIKKIDHTIIGKLQNAKESLNQTFDTESIKMRVNRRRIISTIRNKMKSKNGSPSKIPALSFKRDGKICVIPQLKKTSRKKGQSSRNVINERCLSEGPRTPLLFSNGRKLKKLNDSTMFKLISSHLDKDPTSDLESDVDSIKKKYLLRF